MKQHLLGQTLIELLLAMSLTAILLPVLIVSFTSSREGQAQESQRLRAVQLLKEAQEAVRSVRERGFSEVSVNSSYHPVVSSGTWTLAANSETIGDFTRVIEVSDVYRDASGAIVSFGGTNDPSTKRVTITVSWQSPQSTSIESILYLTRFDNQAFIETTETEFSEGEETGTVVTNTNGGEIILGSGGHGNWCAPDLLANTLDLPGSGIAKGITAIEGKAFTGTGENSSGLSFIEVTLNNDYPPTATVGGTFDGYKTNDVFGETGYGYIATDTNSKEVVIINIGSLPYTESGYFDAPGNGSGESIYVSGNVGYVTASNKLYNFDLTSKNGSRPILDSNGVTLAGTAHRVIVVGNYAYIAIAGSTLELQIVDVSNSTNLQVVGQADVNGQAAYDVFVNPSGTRAYLATAVSSTQDELFIIDVSTKTGNRPVIGSYNSTGMDPKAVTVTTGNRAVLVGTGAEEYQVIDISNEASPQRCGGEQINDGINGVASVLEADSDAYSYIVNGNGSAEFKIVVGGPGGSYFDDGTFTSDVFDAGGTVVFNRLIPDVSLPPTTNVKFQVATADAVSGSCASATYSFVGPDGTSSTYFPSTGGAIPLHDDGSGYENPARCLKYRAFLTTGDFTATPTVNSVSVNYSL